MEFSEENISPCLVTLKIRSKSPKSNHFLRSFNHVSVSFTQKLLDRVETRLFHTELYDPGDLENKVNAMKFKFPLQLPQ